MQCDSSPVELHVREYIFARQYHVRVVDKTVPKTMTRRTMSDVSA